MAQIHNKLMFRGLHSILRTRNTKCHPEADWTTQSLSITCHEVFIEEVPWLSPPDHYSHKFRSCDLWFGVPSCGWLKACSGWKWHFWPSAKKETQLRQSIQWWKTAVTLWRLGRGAGGCSCFRLIARHLWGKNGVQLSAKDNDCPFSSPPLYIWSNESRRQSCEHTSSSYHQALNT